MRLSEWRKAAPTQGAMSDQVLAVVSPVLADLGAERNPECWVAWGEDPDVRYSILAPTPAGLISLAVRFGSPEDGPRVIAKLIRWSKLSVSELGVEAGGGHRVVAVQVETLVLKGMDAEADRICDFVRLLIAGVDDRLQAPAPIMAIGRVVPVVAQTPAATPRASARKAIQTEANITAQLAAPATAPAGCRGAPGRDEHAKEAEVHSAVGTEGRAPEAPPAPVAAPVAPAPTVAPQPESPEQPAPTPIAARAAARQATPDVEPERELDRSGWVTPHAIEAQIPRKPTSKPRKWMP
jgi:hypothetical protein